MRVGKRRDRKREREREREREKERQRQTSGEEVKRRTWKIYVYISCYSLPSIEMDKHRLKYLAYTLQKDAELWAKYKQRSTTDSPTPPPTPRFESLLEHREQDIEQCNMLLLLLLAFLEYNLPLDVMRSTLETAKLTSIG